jgi:hypothetical protein
MHFRNLLLVDNFYRQDFFRWYETPYFIDSMLICSLINGLRSQATVLCQTAVLISMKVSFFFKIGALSARSLLYPTLLEAKVI